MVDELSRLQEEVTGLRVVEVHSVNMGRIAGSRKEREDSEREG